MSWALPLTGPVGLHEALLWSIEELMKERGKKGKREGKKKNGKREKRKRGGQERGGERRKKLMGQ